MRIVVYTALVGSYDHVPQPEVVWEGCDYIMFTDVVQDERIGIWKVLAIPYANKDNTRIARWVKTHPHVLLPDYDYSLWMDANVVVKDMRFYEIVKGEMAKGVRLASFDHIWRDCCYDEGLAVVSMRRDVLCSVLPEMAVLRDAHYPHHHGLCETNCVLRKHGDSEISAMNEDWWRMIDTYSKRDQLSFNYVAWKRGLDVQLFLGKGHNTRNHTYVSCMGHKDTYSKANDLWGRRIYQSYVKRMTPLWDKYTHHCDKAGWIEFQLKTMHWCYNVLLRIYMLMHDVKFAIKKNREV